MSSARRTRAVTAGVIGAVWLAAFGCASRGERTGAPIEQGAARAGDAAELVFGAEQYMGNDGAFVAARDVIRELGFTLERVDAQEGVISTRPKPTAGLLTPWDKEQTTAAQEVDDLLHRHQRVVRVRFEAVGRDEEGIDLRALAGGEVRMRAEVVLERVHVPGKRLDVNSIKLTSYATDPALVERRMQPRYEVPLRLDEPLAARIVAGVRARLGRSPG